ncbi:MAG: HEAT repeat domain-containing protein [Candidatus Thorarchaeota archaeon]
MPENKETEKSTASLNGESDLEGKVIIDSRGEKIGICKSVSIGDDGQIGLSFETEIGEKAVIPTQKIPYSAISKITDVIELKIPIDLKVAKSADELKDTSGKSTEEEKIEAKVNGIETVKTDIKSEEQEIQKNGLITESEMKKPEIKSDILPEKITPMEKTVSPVNVELPIPSEKLAGKITTFQADATSQLSKALSDEEKAQEIVVEEKKPEIIEEDNSSSTSVETLTKGLEESVKKIQLLFNLISSEDDKVKIDAITALTHLTTLSPELGLSLIPKMMKLNEEQQQDVRFAVAEQLEIIGETKPELFKGYFLDLLENAYDEPIEDIRELLIKTLHETAMKVPEIASENLEQFLEDVTIGKKVPEVPSKVIHDTTLKVVSGNFLLTRISIKVRLNFIVKGGKLGARCAEELGDYNATMIGLTIIESFTQQETEKLVNSINFKKIGPIFVEVIQQIIEAFKEGSFSLLNKVVDKKIEIPTIVIEKFYEIKLMKTLEGAKNIPLEVLLDNSFVTPEEAEQIIYKLVMQKRVNATISMSNGRTFITCIDNPIEPVKK